MADGNWFKEPKDEGKKRAVSRKRETSGCAEVQKHKERLTWLQSEHPQYACGTPVAKSDIKKFTDQSKQIVARGFY